LAEPDFLFSSATPWRQKAEIIELSLEKRSLDLSIVHTLTASEKRVIGTVIPGHN
jgi:hypothetical protein